MATNQQKTVQAADHNHFPWTHVIGFVSSIVLTLIALWIGLYTNFALSVKIAVVFTLAFIQAGIQLFMFMHMTESSSGRVQVINTVFAIFVAVVTVLGSVWVMNDH
ncbi:MULTISPECIES: cytochrome aa3 quinol oxidase subunit IV [Bacillaceae]|uniref:cytochrome aa3 quinol oxidase subunit IV n=1 Tax=Bacillaceae TaxID=186817 RepID=UPI000C76D9FD|nr:MULTISPECIES: cytochrome aa3 quinol oxidase subunit IV [Bacillaceae]PLR67778.1 cytochrome aa3 quinol oxidase subunit IV [Bacillus sp. UMB0893]